MLLWKKLYNVLLTGDSKFAKGGSVDIEGTFKIGGTAIEATGDELNRTNDASARIVSTTATALSLSVTAHGERVLLVNTNSTVANTFTLPVATGSGVKFTIINNIAQTQGSVVVAANGTLDVLKGLAVVASSTEEAAAAFLTSATSDKITLNASTSGGLGYDMIECWDSAANTWNVKVIANGNGTLATPFAAT
jgi:hypothetical protein